MRSVLEQDGPAALIGPAGELIEPVQDMAAPVAATAER
jgi:hypothetical protein